MKRLRTLVRALLIISSIFIDLWNLKLIFNTGTIFTWATLFSGTQALLLMSLLIPSIPFAPYIAAAAGFFIGIEVTFSLMDVIGESVPLMLTMTVYAFFAFPYAAYRWVLEMRNRKAAPWKTDSTRSFYRRTKVVIPPGAEGGLLMLCAYFVLLLLILKFFFQMFIDKIESGSFDAEMILIGLGPIMAIIILRSIMREHFEEVREAFRKSHSFTDSIDSTTMELAAHDYNNAERLLDGRISLGDKYIFGSETEVFLEYDKLSAIIAAAVPDSDIAGIIGPIPIEMAEAIAVDPYERKQTEHQLFAETTDGEVYLLCHTPATNGFQTYEKYWKRELCPVFKRIHERNPNCWFYPRIEM